MTNRFFIFLVIYTVSLGSVIGSPTNKIAFSTNIIVKDIESEKELNNLFFEITDQTSGKTVFPKIPVSNHPMLFNLEPENVYTATISKAGYVNYVLTINTKSISKSKQLKSKYQIEITGELFELINDEDYSAFQKSFGTIKFSLQENDFIWNPNQSLYQKRQEIKKMRANNKKVGAANPKQELTTSMPSQSEKAAPIIKKQATADTLLVKSIQSETKTIPKGEMIITYIIFRNGQSNELRKISYEWGGLFYKLNQNDITEAAYNLTKARFGF
jgi:hypothetical protein